MDRFAAILDFAKAMNWLIVVTAELNFRDRGSDPHSPYAILRGRALKLASHGVDCIAFSPGLGLEVRGWRRPNRSLTTHGWSA
jgi:hypothetical protein